MIGRYAAVAARIRQELEDLERVVDRAERGMTTARRHTEESDLFLDSVALNMHDFYAGLERLFRQIAATVDGSVPSGPEWHRDLLRQMCTKLPRMRPQVLSAETAQDVDEYLRFRHVVRNVYTFKFDVEQIERLVQGLRPAFDQVRIELLAFADLLDELAQES